MTADELITWCVTCEICGKEHTLRPAEPGVSSYGQTWASPDDNHPYRNPVSLHVIAQLRKIAGAS